MKNGLLETYRGKKVFLTGHTGFKGSWMLMWLSKLGAQIKGYSLAPENSGNIYEAINGDDLCESVIDDIRKKSRVEKEIAEFEPDFIFHLAAQPLVRRSYEEPVYTYEVNVNGTIHVLEAVRHLNKPCCVVIVTTDKVYENRETHYAYSENDKLGGYDPYSASKAAAEIVVSSYRNSFFNPEKYKDHYKAIATARAGNVIGGGDFAKDRIIPDIVRALQNEQPVVVRNPSAIRPWQHVMEPVSGYLLLAAKMYEDPVNFAEEWNFGPETDDVLTVDELVKKALDVWGHGTYRTQELNDQPHEASLLKLNIQKAKEKLGWCPKLTATQAIIETIEWYKRRDQKNAAELMRLQIDEYSQKE